MRRKAHAQGRPIAGERVELIGEKELQRQLDEIGEAVALSGKAGKDAAVLVANAARGIGNSVSGKLASSYRGLGAKRSGRVVSRLVYAPIIEYGWPARSIGPQGRIERAISQSEGAILAIYQKWVQETIKAKGG